MRLVPIAFILSILVCAGCGGGGDTPAVTVPPLGAPDLSVGSGTVSPTSPVVGDTITLSAPITNIGSAASPATTVTFSLVPTSGPSVVMGTFAVPALSEFQAHTATISLTSFPAGTYVVSVSVAAVSGETAMGNNSNVIVFGVAPTGSG